MSSSKSQKKTKPTRDESAGSDSEDDRMAIEKKKSQQKKKPTPITGSKKKAKKVQDSDESGGKSSDEESDDAPSKKRKREPTRNSKKKNVKKPQSNGTSKKLRNADGGEDHVSLASESSGSEEVKPAPKRVKRTSDSEESRSDDKKGKQSPKKKKKKKVECEEPDVPSEVKAPAKKEAAASGNSYEESKSIKYPASTFASLVKTAKEPKPKVVVEKIAAYAGTEACLLALEPVIRKFLEDAFEGDDDGLNYEDEVQVNTLKAYYDEYKFFDALQAALFDDGSDKRKYSHKVVMDGLVPLTQVFHIKSDATAYTAAEKEYLQASARYFATHSGYAVCPTSKGTRVVGSKRDFKRLLINSMPEISLAQDVPLKVTPASHFLLKTADRVSWGDVLQHEELIKDVGNTKTLPPLTYGMLKETLVHLRETKSFAGCSPGVLMVRHILEAFAEKSKKKRPSAGAKSSGGGKKKASLASSTGDQRSAEEAESGEEDEQPSEPATPKSKRREKEPEKKEHEEEAGKAATEEPPEKPVPVPISTTTSRRFSDEAD